MKNILKQKLFWIGIVLVIAGAVVALVNTKIHPSEKSMTLVEEAIQSGSGAKLKQALAPTVRDAIKQSEKENGYSINWDFALQLLGFTGDISLLQGGYTYDKEGAVEGIRYITVTESKGEISLGRDIMPLMEEGGKLYLNENFY